MGGVNRRFDDETIRDILLSDESNVRAGVRYGCTRELIRQIRTGRLYGDVLPDIPRRRSQSRTMVCTKCKHWEIDLCGFGFPDPLEEGPGFAADCSMYEREVAA